MERVKKQLEDLPCSRRLRPLAKAAADGDEGGVHDGTERSYLIAEFDERGAHAAGSRVYVDEAGAEADEVGVVAVNEVDELGLEVGEVGAELRGEALEGDEGAEVGDVGLGYEVGAEEGGGLEPRGFRVDGVAEEVRRRGSWRHKVRHGWASKTSLAALLSCLWIWICAIWFGGQEEEGNGRSNELYRLSVPGSDPGTGSVKEEDDVDFFFLWVYAFENTVFIL